LGVGRHELSIDQIGWTGNAQCDASVTQLNNRSKVLPEIDGLTGFRAPTNRLG